MFKLCFEGRHCLPIPPLEVELLLFALFYCEFFEDENNPSVSHENFQFSGLVYLPNLFIFSGGCFKATISKGLGLGIIAGSLTGK